MQVTNYPLPMLFLTPIFEMCAKQHEASVDSISIVEIKEGYGRHIHDTCKPYPEGNCFADCDDSDWIVTLQYNHLGYWAIYGVKRHGDIQDVQLWMN